MGSEGFEWRELSFHPERDLTSHAQQREASVQVAQPLLQMPDVTAVVAANDDAALGLLQTLREAGIPPHRWPSIIGFDKRSVGRGSTADFGAPTLRAVGRRPAADLLWHRHHGLAPPTPQQTRVPMKLVPRLSCHLDWSGQFEPVSAPPPFGALRTDIYDAPKGANTFGLAPPEAA